MNDGYGGRAGQYACPTSKWDKSVVAFMFQSSLWESLYFLSPLPHPISLPLLSYLFFQIAVLQYISCPESPFQALLLGTLTRATPFPTSQGSPPNSQDRTHKQEKCQNHLAGTLACPTDGKAKIKHQTHRIWGTCQLLICKGPRTRGTLVSSGSLQSGTRAWVKAMTKETNRSYRSP